MIYQINLIYQVLLLKVLLVVGDLQRIRELLVRLKQLMENLC